MDINQIISEYNGRVQSVIKRFVSSAEDAQDIEQEVYLKTWRNLDKYDNKYNLWSWVSTITTNTCKDHLRKNKKYSQTDSDEEKLKLISDNSEKNETKLIMSERQKLILNKINKLKPKFKDVIVLFDIEELTYEEISQKLNCPIGTVKSRLFNARKILQIELAELLNQEGE